VKFENRKQSSALLDIGVTLDRKSLSIWGGGGGGEGRPLLRKHHLQNYSLTEDTQAKSESF